MEKELNRELANAIEKMTLAKIALRSAAPESLRGLTAPGKHSTAMAVKCERVIIRKVNRLFHQLMAIQ